jgi:hypothetical protein
MTSRKKMPSKKIAKLSVSGHVVGRARFAKISEVEGITMSPAMVKRARTSTVKGLSAEETRKLIIRSYRKG